MAESRAIITSTDDCQTIISTGNSLLKFSEPVALKPTEDTSPARQNATVRERLRRDVGQEQSPQQILNMICPPKKWTDETGRKWIQQVSDEPIVRSDVHKLGEMLDIRLKKRQARDSGICAVRLDLFNQLFDELIRQITLNCPERGIILLRIRDEYRLTLSALYALYISGFKFGATKADETREGKGEFHEEIDKLNLEKDKIKKDINDLKLKFKMMQVRNEEVKSCDEKKQKDEISFLIKTNQQLKEVKCLLVETVNKVKEEEALEEEEKRRLEEAHRESERLLAEKAREAAAQLDLEEFDKDNAMGGDKG